MHQNLDQIHFLKLNDSKTEFILFGSKYSIDNCSHTEVRVGDSIIEPSSAVRKLGAFMDNLMNMDTLIKSKSRNTFYQIRKIGRIRKYLTMEGCKTLIQALIVFRLDYANSLLY